MVKSGVFVTGIGTGVGKTVVAAALTRHYRADYWKPVQCGDLEQSDSMAVRQWSGSSGTVHPGRYRLTRPMSPHAAAAAEQVTIEVSDFVLPSTQRKLIVEGAGGLLVPLNHRETMADLIFHLGLPVVVVVRHYLGSINHTLLTCSVLKEKGIAVEGLVFNGHAVPESEEAILALSGIPLFGRVPELTSGGLPTFVPNAS
jgi:dethiobiotin synthetase